MVQKSVLWSFLSVHAASKVPIDLWLMCIKFERLLCYLSKGQHDLDKLSLISIFFQSANNKVSVVVCPFLSFSHHCYTHQKGWEK